MSLLVELPQVARCKWCGEQVSLAYLGDDNLPPDEIHCEWVSGTVTTTGASLPAVNGHRLVWWLVYSAADPGDTK